MMTTIAEILGYASGFALMGYREPAATVIATSIAINLSLAPLIAVIASRRRRSAAIWGIAGLALGMWTLAAILLLGQRRPTRPTAQFPPTSDAA
ncbi:MAG TPA: hypothetical protein VIX59_08880 [Candidatus Binataceae bacterium]